MISNQHRFHGYNRLHAVYRKGRTVRSPFMSLKYYINPHQTSYRLAVVVSRKVHKSSVVRNRIRRRLFEAHRKLADLFNGPFDMVVVVYNEQVADMPAADLQKMVRRQLKQAGIIGTKTTPNPRNSV